MSHGCTRALIGWRYLSVRKLLRSAHLWLALNVIGENRSLFCMTSATVELKVLDRVGHHGQHQQDREPSRA
jgi:hypothetical protein